MTAVLALDLERRDNADAIADLARLGRLRPDDRILDATYGLGRFWTRWQPATLVACDINPRRARDVVADATVLPFADRSFDVVAFDPPYKLGGTPRRRMDADYGVDHYRPAAKVAALIEAGTVEACRTAARAVATKCMDQVSSGRQHWQTVDVHVLARRLGWRVVEEMYVLEPAPQPGKGRQRHAWGRPSTLLLLERTRRS